MRISTTILAIGAALAAAPAMAQINVGLGGNAGGGLGVGLGGPGGGISVGGGGNVGVGGDVGIGVNPGATIGGVTGRLDSTVNRVDGLANRNLDRLGGGLQAATSADLFAGAEVRNDDGRKVGIVQSVHGNMAVLVKGDKTMHVPVASLYRGATGLVTSLTNRELRAAASASASASADAGAGVRN